MGSDCCLVSFKGVMMYGIHRELMGKVDEIDGMVSESRRPTGFDEKLEELRELVRRAWDETGHGIGGFGPPCD